MSPNAQNALRGMIEMYSHNAVFILTCNNELKIIPALKDEANGRCRHIRFSPLLEEEVSSYMKQVLESEGIQVSDELLRDLGTLCKGRIRFFLNLVQGCANNGTLDLAKVRMPVGEVEQIFLMLENGDFRSAVDLALRIPPFELTRRLSEFFYIKELFRGEEIDGVLRLRLLTEIAEHDRWITQGPDLTVQVRALVYRLGAILWKVEEV
jgi:DNA polymerase III delta prime subunit